MKKYLLLLLIPMMLFNSCSKSEEKTVELDSFFNTKVLITTASDEYEVILSSKGGGVWQIQYVSPERIGGVLHTLTPENYSVSYEYMSQVVSLDRYYKSDISYVTRILDMCFTKAEFKKQSDKTYKCKGIINECEYDIVIDSDSTPLYIDIPSAQIRADFSDFELVK